MDDVSKVQEINNIARDLMKHGQASSMEEAIKMAQQQQGGATMPEAPQPPAEQPTPEASAAIQEGPQVDTAPERAAPAEGEPSQTLAEQSETPAAEHDKQLPDAAVEGEISDERLKSVEDILSRQQSAVSNVTSIINTHTKQFEELNNKINGLIAELSSLKTAVEKMSNSPVIPPMKQKDAQQGQTQFKKEEAPPKPAEQPKKEGSGHARTGNFNPDDVSIEKFFYYGNK